MGKDELSGVGRAELEERLKKAEATIADLEKAMDERERFVSQLQDEGTRKLIASLPRVVRAFHAKFGHPIEHTPKVPSYEQVRFRLGLIAEEFLELLDAVSADDERFALAPLAQRTIMWIRNAPIRVDLPAFYDALIDLAWVIEGTHAVFGTDAAPGLAEVARANMEKDPVYVEAKDGHHKRPGPSAKPLKPEGWQSPDMERVLREQGWVWP
jgi:predicted HAD superfamily Cof-like phosphohydrolase